VEGEYREYVERLRSAISMGIPPPRWILRMVFVNREREMRTLASDLEQVVRSGAGRARVVVGGAGYGKSALLEHFKDYVFEHYSAAFSYVEMRELAGTKPSEMLFAIYRAAIERMEDREGRRGRELLTEVASTLLGKFSGKIDGVLFRLRGRYRSRVVRRFERLGDAAVSRALACMAVDDLNPIAYDYLLGVRGLEPDEARLFEKVLGSRIPWRLQRESLVEAITTIARAVREAGMKALVVAIDEIEMLENVQRNLLQKFLAEFTALVEASARAPLYIIVSSTPDFWSEGEKCVKTLYPFLFQRLDRGKIELGGLGEADARALARKILGLYEKAYGRTAVADINGDALGFECFRRVEPLGHPRRLLQTLLETLDERVVKAGS